MGDPGEWRSPTPQGMMRRLGTRLPKCVTIDVVYDEPPEPICLVADDGMGGWVWVGNGHVEAQTSGTFEVWAQEIGGHMSMEMSVHKMGSARAMAHQRPRKTVSASSVSKCSLKRTRDVWLQLGGGSRVA